jgi:hypothetical protein
MYALGANWRQIHTLGIVFNSLQSYSGDVTPIFRFCYISVKISFFCRMPHFAENVTGFQPYKRQA